MSLKRFLRRAREDGFGDEEHHVNPGFGNQEHQVHAQLNVNEGGQQEQIHAGNQEEHIHAGNQQEILPPQQQADKHASVPKGKRKNTKKILNLENWSINILNQKFEELVKPESDVQKPDEIGLVESDHGGSNLELDPEIDLEKTDNEDKKNNSEEKPKTEYDKSDDHGSDPDWTPRCQ